MNSRSQHWSLNPSLKQIFLEALVLGILAAAVGLSLNYKLVFNAFAGKSVATPATSTPGTKAPTAETLITASTFPIPVELGELDELLATGALLVDSRNSADFEKSHLAGAISLPLATLESHLEDFKQQVSTEQPLVIYCSGYGCPDSFDLGMHLIEAGYRDVLVYEGGFPEWRDAGRPLERGVK